MKDLHSPLISYLIAAELARLHSLPSSLFSSIPSLPRSPQFHALARQWTQQAATIQFTDPHKQTLLSQLSLSSFSSELPWLSARLRALHSPVVFCHCDLQEGNILYDGELEKNIQGKEGVKIEEIEQILLGHYSLPATSPITPYSPSPSTGSANMPPSSPSSTRSPSLASASPISSLSRHFRHHPLLHFIDFEYSSFNSRGFDLANHLCEHFINYQVNEYPNYQIDSERDWPSEEHFKRFLTVYTRYSRFYQYQHQRPAHGGGAGEAHIDYDVSEAELALLYREALWFTLASHYLWVVWSVLQATSNISFGYLEYGRDRIEQYFKMKKILEDTYPITEEELKNAPLEE
jgi:thiamine kinase-like enzyme